MLEDQDVRVAHSPHAKAEDSTPLPPSLRIDRWLDPLSVPFKFPSRSWIIADTERCNSTIITEVLSSSRVKRTFPTLGLPHVPTIDDDLSSPFLS